MTTEPCAPHNVGKIVFIYIENTCRKLQTDDIQRSGHKLVKVHKSILVRSLLCLKGVALMHLHEHSYLKHQVLSSQGVD